MIRLVMKRGVNCSKQSIFKSLGFLVLFFDTLESHLETITELPGSDLFFFNQENIKLC
jgi:hypothetical protein